MKYLEKFVNYLNESNIEDLTDEDLEEILIPMTELGMDWEISDSKTITEGDYSGHKYRTISFKNNFKVAPTEGYYAKISDDKFWEFLDELTTLKNRLESTKVFINKNWSNYIVITFLQKQKAEDTTFMSQKLYNDIGRKINSSKSDFVNSMIRKLDLENNKITVSVTNFWTDRKWSLFSRDLDTSNFDVKVEKSKNAYGDESAVVTFTLKNQL